MSAVTLVRTRFSPSPPLYHRLRRRQPPFLGLSTIPPVIIQRQARQVGRLAVGFRRVPGGQAGAQVFHRGAFDVAGQAEDTRGRNPVREIAHGETGGGVEILTLIPPQEFIAFGGVQATIEEEARLHAEGLVAAIRAGMHHAAAGSARTST